MELETFLKLPVEEVARIVRADGPKVCVFPINGTRRWFLLEYPEWAKEDFANAYMEITWRRQIELYKLFFDHGVDTLLTPIFGPDLLQRGNEYMKLVEPGLLWLAHNEEILDFYTEYNVRVKVYGDLHRHLQNTPYEHVLDEYKKVNERTSSHKKHRLFFGVCASDATQSVAELSLHFYDTKGFLPDKRQIIAAYYGEYVEPVDLFIGFDRLTAFDMPLVATGNEDLYFTVSPSLYMEAHTLRTILYDHLYTRRVSESYDGLTPEDWHQLRQFYAKNRYGVLGLGKSIINNSFWIPIPQVIAD